MPDVTEKEKAVEHPMEEILGIESGSTMVPHKETESKALTVPQEYDTKDHEIETELEDVRKAAYDAFETQQDTAEEVDPKYSARNAEVAAVYLRTALDAIREKSLLKQHKDKLHGGRSASDTPTKTVNIFADRNTIMRELDELEKAQAIDVEFVEGNAAKVEPEEPIDEN